MKKNEQSEHEKKRLEAIEVGKMLPETIQKIDHYKALLKADTELIDLLENRQRKFFLSALKKAREKVEIITLNAIFLTRQKVFESYLNRKAKYDQFLEEMTREVQPNFSKVMDDAKKIKTNLRLVAAIEGYESREDVPTMNEKIQFYLYMKQEILNNKKSGK